MADYKDLDEGLRRYRFVALAFVVAALAVVLMECTG